MQSRFSDILCVAMWSPHRLSGGTAPAGILADTWSVRCALALSFICVYYSMQLHYNFTADAMTTHKLTREHKTGTLHLRIKPSIKDLAQNLADEDHRTLSNWIEAVILEKALATGKQVRFNASDGERS